MAILNIGGVANYSSQLLTYLGFDSPSGFSASGFFVAILAIFALAASAGIIVGWITSSSPVPYIIAAFASVLTVLIGSDLIGIYYTMATECPVASGCAWVSKIILLLIFPLLGAFGISIVEWWSGTD